MTTQAPNTPADKPCDADEMLSQRKAFADMILRKKAEGKATAHLHRRAYFKTHAALARGVEHD